MKILIVILLISLTIPLLALDPYTMTLEECRAYIKANNLKWEAGVTPYTNMPKEALKIMLTDLYLPIDNNTKKSNNLINSRTKNPEYLDWTNMNGTNWMTSVKNQGNCGSCWSFAVMGTWEAMININSNNPNIDWDASEQYMVSTCYTGGDCGGGPAGTGPANWVRANGVPDEACYTYKARNTNCNERCGDWSGRLKYIKTVTNVCTSANTEAIKAALRNGPVGTAMQATAMMLRFYKGGTLGEEAPSLNIGYPLNHAVVIVGWDDSRNGGSWKWKNSWGTGWGESGYGWTQFGASQMGAYTWSCTANSEGAGGITVTYPNGGENFSKGEQIPVRWSSEGSIAEVKIYLTTDSKASWITLSERTTNDGQENFPVPDNVNSSNCYVRVKDYADTGDNSTDDSDNPFTIRSTGFNNSTYASKLPVSFALEQNKPNPFKTKTTIPFSLAKDTEVTIRIIDMLGRTVKVIKKNDFMKRGNYSITFNADNLSSGIFTYIIETKYFTDKKNLVIIK